MRRLSIAASVALLGISLSGLCYALLQSEERVLGFAAAVLLLLTVLALVVLATRQHERIHDFKRALRRSRLRAQAVIEASPDGIVLLRETTVRRANPAFRALLAIPPDAELDGRNMLDLVEPDDHSKLSQWLETRQRGMAEPERIEFHGRRETGLPIALEAHAALVPFREGRMLALFLRDLSGRRTLEKRARHFERLETLADLAENLIGEFGVIYERIRKRSHGALANGSTEDKQAALEAAERSAARGCALVRRVRTMAPEAVDHGDREPFELSALLTELGNEFQRALPPKLALRIEALPREVLAVTGDSVQVRHALWQLLQNAAEAQESGEIMLRLRALELDETLAAQRPGTQAGRYALLEVRDTGRGMPESDQARAFSPFFTTKGTRASGLGLTMVYAVARSHGGFVELDSLPERGTIARLAFPAIDAAELGESALATRDPRRAWRGRETLLLVDDDPAARIEVRPQLEGYGYHVECVANPRDALGRLRQRPEIDLVLLDMVLPGFNGPDVLERILRHWPGQRVMMISPYPLPDQEEMALRFGALSIYQKPFIEAELAQAVREALDAPPPASMLTGPA